MNQELNHLLCLATAYLPVLDEKRLDKRLGGGVLCHTDYGRYEVSKQGEVVFVAYGGKENNCDTQARRLLRDFLTTQYHQRDSHSKRCKFCGKPFAAVNPNACYCSATCKDVSRWKQPIF